MRGLALLLACAAALAAPAAAADRLGVYAASSLTEVLPRIADESYSFGGSNALATQIGSGAPADVFASADPRYTQDLYRRGLVERPVTFASNRLVLVVPKSNPAGLRSVFDLKGRSLRLVLGAPRVPVGDYARATLRKLGLSSVLAQVVSEEPDVKSVVGKVALGEADAGFVYATDVRPVADRVTAIGLPRFAQPKVRYEVAVVRASGHRAAARAFVALLTRDERARTLLRQAGFGLR